MIMILNEFEQDIQNQIKRLLEKGDFKAAKVIYDAQNLPFLKEKQHRTEPFNDSAQT